MFDTLPADNQQTPSIPDHACAPFQLQFEAATGTSLKGTIGRDLEAQRDSINLDGRLAADTPLRPFRIVTFYTEDNGYAEHASRLKATLDAFGLDYTLAPIQSTGSWERNCAFKAEFIYEQWKASDVPIVWLDADASVEAFPALFGQIRADVALHKWTWDHARHETGWEFCSGTLYFGKSERTELLLQQWILRCNCDPLTWDQVHLSSAWCDVSSFMPLETVWLPRAYLQIDGAPALEPTVIRHGQASRALPANVKHGKQPLQITADGLRDRETNRIWRTPEELFWIAEGVHHIIPDTGFEFPEGFDVGAALRQAIGEHGPVLEIGCGVGRIASLFKPDEYIGVDVNPNSLLQARAQLPEHELRIFDHGYHYPHTPTVMFYTVLLHVADDQLAPLLIQAARGRKRFIIAELMDRRWRRDGNPPVFNRDPEEYILLMHALGFKLTGVFKQEYQRYAKNPWNVGRDSRLTILTFDAL
jgi:SAM-dependent methyltransferase